MVRIESQRERMSTWPPTNTNDSNRNVDVGSKNLDLGDVLADEIGFLVD